MAPKNAKRGLGKGLDAMIPAKVSPKKEEKDINVAAPEGAVVTLKTTELVNNKNQPRKTFDEDKILELADSVEKMESC